MKNFEAISNNLQYTTQLNFTKCFLYFANEWKRIAPTHYGQCRFQLLY